MPEPEWLKKGSLKADNSRYLYCKGVMGIAVGNDGNSPFELRMCSEVPGAVEVRGRNRNGLKKQGLGRIDIPCLKLAEI
jgi:hypothetical protein